MLKRKHFFTVALCVLLIAATVLFAASPSFAYFRALFDKVGENTVMVELIFDRLNFDGPNAEKLAQLGFTDEQDGVEVSWGSKQNPYVISAKHHIQNLSVLQNSGFFAGRVEKDENGEPVLVDGKTVPVQSYFLVCTPDGAPVTVDCEGMTVEPVGNHENPFTGVIFGAPLEGTDTYKTYGTSVSAIANITVASKLDEPDIGFFGRLGYCGTYDEETVTVTGFAAHIENLLFADVTVKSEKSFLGMLADWWERFTSHLNRSEERQETHHVGIVAGHAEFATLKNVSVYYSEGVPAFDLVSNAEGSNTNYYSITGILGLLDRVNPTPNEEDGTLDGASGITDRDIIGDGSSGGGGEVSGSLTGYFLAKNLFDRHELTINNEEDKKSAYDVKEMQVLDENNKVAQLFSYVVMSEGPIYNRTNVTYYYFNDTVFTFAMSASSKDAEEDAKEIDYVMKLWSLEENPVIYGTSSPEKWEYTDDLGSEPRISYKLTAVEEFTAGEYYVLTYVHDGIIYVFDMTDATKSGRYVYALPANQIHTDAELEVATSYFSDGSLKEMNIIGTNKAYFDNAFYHASSSVRIQNPTYTNYKFGFEIPYASGQYGAPSLYYGDAAASKISTLSGAKTAYLYDYSVEYAKNGKFYLYSEKQTLGSWYIIGGSYTYVSAMLRFDPDTKGLAVEYDMNTSSDDNLASIASMKDNTNLFTIMKLSTNELDENNQIKTLGSGNHELTPKNIVPVKKTETDPETGENVTSLDTLYGFDPSTHVLEYNEDEDAYRLSPIRYHKLNNGTGDVLTSLNHILKLYEATDGNFSLDFGGSLDLYSSGGVLKVPIGTTGKQAKIPEGMIAFHITEADATNKSYINIIVAVNPEQTTACTVGLWQTNESFWGSSFDLSSPDQSFPLPISKTAASEVDSSYMIKVYERIGERSLDGEKKEYYTETASDGTNETSYVYLGSEYALIYHSFEVEEPGVYMLGSKAGPLSVAYFSVSGAAGAGNDGMTGSPLGTVDFVYANDNKIITTNMTSDAQPSLLSEEDYDYYYPSYLFVSMLPEETKIQMEKVVLRRFIANKQNGEAGTRRHMSITGNNQTRLRSISVFLEDAEDKRGG